MEELLKLTTSNSLKLSDFNFNSFSTSKNWIGYFERKDSYSIELVDEAAELFRLFFKEEINNIITMTALVYDDDIDGKDEVLLAYKPIHDRFKEIGILQEFNNDFSENIFNNTPLPYNCVRFDFGLDWSDIKDLSGLLMSYTYKIGQRCFFIFKNLNLAVYPHDDTGFGCIGLNGNTSKGIEFLEFCKLNKNFKVVLKDNFIK